MAADAPVSGISQTVGPQDQPRLSARSLGGGERPSSLGMTRTISRQSNVSQPRGMRDYTRR
jgi:hypothetical protein